MTFLSQKRLLLGLVLTMGAGFSPGVRAEPPEFVATVGPGFSQLTTDGQQLWALRYGVVGAAKRVLALGDLVSGEPIPLPVDCVHAALAPDGVLFAVSVQKWRSAAYLREWDAATGEWALIATVAAALDHDSSWTRLVPLADRVLISLPNQNGFGGDSLFRGLVSVDRVTHAQTFVPQDVVAIVCDGAALYGTLQTEVPGGLRIDAAKSVDGGLTWAPIEVAWQTLNDPYPPHALGGPKVAMGGRLFFSNAFATSSFLFQHEGGPSIAVHTGSVPSVHPQRLLAMAVARGGESWIGCFRERPMEIGAAEREFVRVSHHYLRDFATHDMDDFGHLDLAALPDAFYLLREGPGGGTLHRVPLPAKRLPLAEEAQLRIAQSERVFIDPVINEPTTSAVLELTPVGEAGTYLQLQTSTDLRIWEPLGLPVPVGAVETILIDPDVPRRFFK